MGKKPEQEPGAFSIAVAKGIADKIEAADMSQAAVARRSEMSATYLGERLLLRKSFTLHDIEKLSRTLHFDPARFLIDVDTEPLDVPEVRPGLRLVDDVGGPTEADHLQDAALDEVAASTDATSVDPSRDSS